MKIQKQTKGQKKIVLTIILFIAVLLVGAVCVYLYRKNYVPEGRSNTADEQTEVRFASDRDQSGQIQSAPDIKNEAPNTDQPSALKDNTESGKQKIPMVVLTDQSNNTLYVRGGTNYPVSGGACYAVLSGPSGQSIRKESAVLQNPASADCKTIPVPIDELAAGSWTVILYYASDAYEGVSDEASFAI